MDPQAFQEMIDRYSEELMRTAARSPHPPAGTESAKKTEPTSGMSPAKESALPVEAASAAGPQPPNGVPALEETMPPVSAALIEHSAPPLEVQQIEETSPPSGAAAPLAGELLPETNRPESGRGQDALQSIHLETISYEEFLEKNPKTGTLRVQASIAQRAYPVPDAQVVVDKEFLEGNRVFATGVTDANGILDGIVLPTPDKSLSDSPTGKPPYALYDIHVTHPKFREEVYKQVPVFDGIKSIQPVRFLPNSVLPEWREGEQ